MTSWATPCRGAINTSDLRYRGIPGMSHAKQQEHGGFRQMMSVPKTYELGAIALHLLDPKVPDLKQVFGSFVNTEQA